MVNWAHKAHVKGGTGKRRVFRFHSVNGPIAVTDGQTATFVIFVLPLEKEQRTHVVPRAAVSCCLATPSTPQATVDQPIELRSNIALADRYNGGIRRK